MAADLWPFVLFGFGKYRTVESYRRCMVARWLSGRFCEPTTIIVSRSPTDGR